MNTRFLAPSPSSRPLTFLAGAIAANVAAATAAASAAAARRVIRARCLRAAVASDAPRGARTRLAVGTARCRRRRLVSLAGDPRRHHAADEGLEPT